MTLLISDILWGHRQSVVLLESCNALSFSSPVRAGKMPNADTPIIWEILVPKQEKLHGSGPYEEGTLMSLPLPMAASFATSMVGFQATVQDMLDLANRLDEELKDDSCTFTQGEVLYQNVLGRNEDFYSITQVMKRPVDIETGQLMNLDGSVYKPTDRGLN